MFNFDLSISLYVTNQAEEGLKKQNLYKLLSMF